MGDERNKRVYNYQLAEQLVRVETDLEHLRGMVESVDSKVCSNSRALRGTNGKAGLLSQVDRLEKSVESLVKTQVDLHDVIMGDKDHAGLREEVHDIQQWRKSLTYWYVLLGGALVTGIANVIIQIALHGT